MPKFIPRTKAQNSAIHSLLGKYKFDGESKAEFVFDITNGRTESTKEMSFDEANEMIHRLGGRTFTKQMMSRRTENYHKQKDGIETIATSTHKDHLKKLARERNMSEAGLGDLSARVNKGLRTPRTSKEVNRVIEAIKAMNRRDRTFAGFKKEDKEAA